jgi:hypothetical protein
VRLPPIPIPAGATANYMEVCLGCYQFTRPQYLEPLSKDFADLSLHCQSFHPTPRMPSRLPSRLPFSS